MDEPLFLHLFTSCVMGIWVVSHSLPINNAAINILMQLFERKYEYVNGAYKRAGILLFWGDFLQEAVLHPPPPLSFLPNTLSKNQGLLALSLMTVASSREEQMSLSK